MILQKFSAAHQDRIFGLDLLRAMAIIMVVMGHTRWMIDVFPAPLKALLQGSGILGVELFFLLSGFLIGRILLRTFEANNYQLSWLEIKRFWIKRWIRTLPNYLFILLVFILVYRNDLAQNTLSYFIFFQNFSSQAEYFFNESWTLAIEEHSYLLAPLSLYLVSRVLLKFYSGRAVFLINTLFIILIITGIRMYYSYQFVHVISEWDDVRKVVLFRLDTIFYGFIGAYLAHYHHALWIKYKYTLLVLGVVTALPVLIYYKKVIKYVVPSSFENTFLISALAVSILMMLPFFSDYKKMKYKLVSVAITFVSVISYSLYLINDKLISKGFEAIFAPLKLTFAPMLGVYLLYWFTVLLLAYLCYLCIERPTMAWRNHPYFKS